MPPRREPCRNFMRGSCQYGDRCKFLHVSPQPSKSNSFGFGTQTGSQFQQTNPFGFGVQNNSQARGSSEFGSKQNQFKPFENKWTRFSPINASNSSASRQPDNQPVASSHKCTDPDSCKRQILEDFEQERPLWKLTCYGHSKNGPCDIVGDLSYEELRAAAYDDAKRGLSLQSIVEKERNLLNSKLLELENFIHNPYKGPGNTTLSPHNPFPSSIQNPPVISQSSNPPAFSSFSQLGASLNPGVTGATIKNSFGQSKPFQNGSQISSTFQINNSPFGTSGSIGNQLPNQTTPQNIFSSSSSSFGNSSLNVGNNPFSTSAISAELFGSINNQMPNLFAGSSSGPNGMASSMGIHLSSETSGSNIGDNSVWMKDEWSIGEIPEEAPPDTYCR